MSVCVPVRVTNHHATFSPGSTAGSTVGSTLGSTVGSISESIGGSTYGSTEGDLATGTTVTGEYVFRQSYVL